MRKFQRRITIRALLYSWPLYLGLAALLFFLGRATWHAYQELDSARDAYAEAQESRRGIEEKRANLEGRLEELSNVYGFEKELRERYSLHKPGEEVVIFIRRTPEASSSLFSEPVSWWGRFRAWIKHR